MAVHNTGLTTVQAKKLLVEIGPNEIIQKSKHTIFSIFVSQFTSILVILLIIAAITSLFLGHAIDGSFILLIVFLNAILGFAQEYKAEKAIEALKKMTISTVRVIRDGSEGEIDSRDLVPGDIIMLEEGDTVPADCLLIESLHLEVNEASLTGESFPVEKKEGFTDKGEIFMGSIISQGRCKGRVTMTGMRTRFGKIASSLSEIKEEETSLHKKINALGKQLGLLGISASLLVIIIGLVQKQPLIDMLLAGISLAVASVPEGLPAVITITLAVGMSRMAKKRAILRKLSAIEALGSTTIIATDKTGTLTKNQMRVAKVWVDGESFDIHDPHFNPEINAFGKLLSAGVVCNNAGLVLKKSGHDFDVLGDTTEGALLLLAQQKGKDIKEIKSKGELTEEYAFDPVSKLMSVIWKDSHGACVFTKGAPETVLKKCKFILTSSGVKELNTSRTEEIENAFAKFGQEGLRNLALAYKDVSNAPSSREETERNLVFLGFVGIADPAREEVVDAIVKAKIAGIKTIMVTGDNEITARAIAKKIGLINENDEIITGKQFEKLSDSEALKKIDNIRIFARTTPHHKLRIVSLLRKKGNIVTVTGDGVNDAPALKQADVGVAMGITGTDVAKEASDMIITDDNYSTLVLAIEEGRTIFDNIKSAIQYLIGCNLGEIAAVITGMLLGWPLIFTPLQLLYINLVTDGLPAIALAVTPKREGVMRMKPRTGKHIFEKSDWYWMLEISILTTITTLAAFYFGLKVNNLDLARSMGFTTVILVQQFALLDIWIREQSVLKTKIFGSLIFMLAFFGPLVLQPLLIYIPYLTDVFKISYLTPVQLLFVLLLSSILVFSAEIRKSILNRKTSPYPSPKRRGNL